MLLSFFKRGVCILLVICTVVALSCCQIPQKKYTEYSFDYFDTLTEIIGYENNRADFDAKVDEILSELERYNKLFDIYRTYDGINNLATLNNSAGGAPVKVDREIIELLEFCITVHGLTDGYVNAAMGSVLSVWHAKRESAESDAASATLPEYSHLAERFEHTDISKIIIDKEASTVTLRDPEMRLDVGAIAKGYATERVAESLEAQGVSGYILNVGGNVRTLGERPGGDFVVAIENPDTDDTDNPYIEFICLNGMSLVTSGVYQRYYTVNGGRYHHVIDKDTLFPAEGYLSVSVIAKDSGLADSLSTALMCMPIDEGRLLLDGFDDVYVMWVTDSGERFYSVGFSDFITER